MSCDQTGRGIRPRVGENDINYLFFALFSLPSVRDNLSCTLPTTTTTDVAPNFRHVKYHISASQRTTRDYPAPLTLEAPSSEAGPCFSFKSVYLQNARSTRVLIVDEPLNAPHFELQRCLNIPRVILYVSRLSSMHMWLWLTGGSCYRS